ncbi:MAG: efflux RND transporter periplasmic adaptor subunit [Planctomycetota bacterium]|nr:efflux RND transporter periplasmic adaptor subunit [Planctomycetota bacterium]
MPRFNLCWLLITIAACAGANSETAKENSATAKRLVRAVPAELRQIQREIRTTGFLESEHQDKIATSVSGCVRHLFVDEGSKVAKGTLLAEIDSREISSAKEQLVVQRAGKQVDQELAGLEVEAAGRRRAQAAIDCRRAKAEFDRQSQMNAEFVSPKALQDSELAFQGTEESAKVAEFNERKSKLDVVRIGNLVAELDAKIRELEVRIEHHKITAPFAGVISKRYAADGATLTAGAPLFDMVDPGNIIAWLDRPQSELDLVRNAKQVMFLSDALPGRNFTADIDLISPVIDKESGHFRLRMRVRASDSGTLLHGMFVRARILAESMREALMVPKAAVLSEGDVSVVMVLRDNKASRIDLDPGLEQQDFVECRNRGPAGLQPGELVIVSGHEDLKDESAVILAEPAAELEKPAAAEATAGSKKPESKKS